MITCKCIEKFRDKHDKIYGYRLVDTTGQIRDLRSHELKLAIQNKQIEVLNLKLTSDNRLIDTNELAVDNQDIVSLVSTKLGINLHKQEKSGVVTYECTKNIKGLSSPIRIILSKDKNTYKLTAVIPCVDTNIFVGRPITEDKAGLDIEDFKCKLKEAVAKCIDAIKSKKEKDTAAVDSSGIYNKLRSLGLNIVPCDIHNVVALTAQYCEDYDLFELNEQDEFIKIKAPLNEKYLGKMAGKHYKFRTSEVWMIFPETISYVLLDSTYCYDFESTLEYFGHTILVEKIHGQFSAYLIPPLEYTGKDNDWPVTYASLTIGGSVRDLEYSTDNIMKLNNAKVVRRANLDYHDNVRDIELIEQNTYLTLSTILFPIKYTLYNMSISLYKETIYNSEAFALDEIGQLNQVYVTDPIVTYYNPIDDSVLIIHWRNLVGYEDSNCRSHVCNFEVDYDYIKTYYNPNILNMNCYTTLDGESKDYSDGSTLVNFELVILDNFRYQCIADDRLRAKIKSTYSIPNIAHELVNAHAEIVKVPVSVCFNN